MSAADDIGKSAIGGPTGVVVSLARGFLSRAFRPSKPTVYKIGGQRVSGPTFRALVPFTLPGQRPGRMPAPTVAVQPPTATKPADPGYRPDLTERRIPPLKRPTPPPAPPRAPPPGGTSGAVSGPDRMPVPPRGTPQALKYAGAWLRRAGYVGTIIFTVEWISRKWAEYFPGQPLPDKPPPARGGAGSQGGKGAQRPQLPPEIIFSPTINVQLPPVPREPGSVSRARDPLTQIKVNAKRIPEPKLTQIKVTAKRVPVPVRPPSVYSQLLAKYGPTALPLLGTLMAPKRNKKKRPGSRGEPATPVVPSIPGLTPGLDPGLALQPTPADFPLFSGGSYFDSTPQQRNCDCAPKKKRGPKKKRTKCYTGRFTERANGLRKYEKRAIKCR